MNASGILTHPTSILIVNPKDVVASRKSQPTDTLATGARIAPEITEDSDQSEDMSLSDVIGDEEENENIVGADAAVLPSGTVSQKIRKAATLAVYYSLPAIAIALLCLIFAVVVKLHFQQQQRHQ